MLHPGEKTNCIGWKRLGQSASRRDVRKWCDMMDESEASGRRKDALPTRSPVGYSNLLLRAAFSRIFPILRNEHYAASVSAITVPYDNADKWICELRSKTDNRGTRYSRIRLSLRRASADGYYSNKSGAMHALKNRNRGNSDVSMWHNHCYNSYLIIVIHRFRSNFLCIRRRNVRRDARASWT